MTQGDNFVLIACFLFCGLRQFKELRDIIDNVFTILELQIFIIRLDILSWPWALLMSKARIIFKISWSSKSTAEILASHKQFVSVGIEL